MKARAVSYGAVELKQMEHRYMSLGLAFSVAIHFCVILVYIFKGLVVFERPPIIPLYPRDPRPDGRQIEVYRDLPNPGTPRITRGVPKGPGGKYAIPVPVPDPPSNEDTLLFKRGDPNGNGEPGDDLLLGEGGDGVGIAAILPPEEPPPPFVPVEKEPVMIKRVEPAYPELAIKAGLEGKVWVKIWVDREGRAHKAEMLRSTADIFNEAALAAAMKFVFVPAYMNGGPVAVWVSIPFTFKFKR